MISADAPDPEAVITALIRFHYKINPESLDKHRFAQLAAELIFLSDLGQINTDISMLKDWVNK